VHLFTLDGETHSIQEWAEIWGVPRSTARNRIYTLESKVEADSA
jgi:Fic family protein